MHGETVKYLDLIYSRLMNKCASKYEVNIFHTTWL